MKLDPEITTLIGGLVAATVVQLVQQTYALVRMHRGMARVKGIKTQTVENYDSLELLHQKVDKLANAVDELHCNDYKNLV